MAVGALDDAILVRDPAVVAGRLHAVMGTERVIAPGQVLAGVLVQVAECGREAIAAVLERRPAQDPQRVLQPFGHRLLAIRLRSSRWRSHRRGDVALAAEDDVRMLETGVGQPEVIETMVEPGARDGHAEVAHVGEVRQPHAARLMDLAENDLLVGAMHGAPRADAALQGAARACG